MASFKINSWLDSAPPGFAIEANPYGHLVATRENPDSVGILALNFAVPPIRRLFPVQEIQALSVLLRGQGEWIPGASPPVSPYKAGETASGVITMSRDDVDGVVILSVFSETSTGLTLRPPEDQLVALSNAFRSVSQ
jgi:hypothetical protein